MPETEPEFRMSGVRIGKRLRSLTRAGQVVIRDGRLLLLTSRGEEIASAPVAEVRAVAGFLAARRRALAQVGGTGYLLTLRRGGAQTGARLVAALRNARTGPRKPGEPEAPEPGGAPGARGPA
jgi:hypothetical protein